MIIQWLLLRRRSKHRAASSSMLCKNNRWATWVRPDAARVGVPRTRLASAITSSSTRGVSTATTFFPKFNGKPSVCTGIFVHANLQQTAVFLFLFCGLVSVEKFWWAGPCRDPSHICRRMDVSADERGTYVQDQRMREVSWRPRASVPINRVSDSCGKPAWRSFPYLLSHVPSDEKAHSTPPSSHRIQLTPQPSRPDSTADYSCNASIVNSRVS